MRIFGKYYINATGDHLINGVQTVLATVVVNTGTAASVLTLYDGTDNTGAVIAVIDASSKGSFVYLCHCNTGLFAVLSGANSDITVTYE